MLGASFPPTPMTDAQHTTHDPYLAAFLLSEEAVLLGCRRIGPKKVEFHFAADWRLHELLRLYWSSRPVSLAPARLFQALRHLKSRTVVQS